MIQVFDYDQYSPDWWACRRGIPTASEFKTLLRTKGRGEDGTSVTRKKYLYRLAGEIITGEAAETYSNAHMERGKEMEAEARDYYAFLSDDPVTQVGFVRDDDKGAGCSPDSFVGDVGVLEIKTALPDILIDHILKGEFPPEHKAQTQGALWVSDREWVDIIIFWRGMTPFVKRAHRDETYIKDLASAVAGFNVELGVIVERIRRYGASDGSSSGALKQALRQSLEITSQ